MFSYISAEQRVRPDHPLRPIRAVVDWVLEELSPRFNRLYAKAGRPSIAPEKLLRALLLQLLYTVRSERMLTEQGGSVCDAGLLMAEQIRGRGRVTVGGDRGYDQGALRGRAEADANHAPRGAARAWATQSSG